MYISSQKLIYYNFLDYAMTINLHKTRKLIKKKQNKKGSLIPLLQEVQTIYGYVPNEAVELISKALSIAPVQIYGVLSFYSQFYTSPRGKYIIKICQGTACHIMGGREIFDYISDKLSIGEGGTTEDRIFSLERVFCLGCCGIAPVVVVNDEFYGKCDLQKIDNILARFRN